MEFQPSLVNPRGFTLEQLTPSPSSPLGILKYQDNLIFASFFIINVLKKRI